MKRARVKGLTERCCDTDRVRQSRVAPPVYRVVSDLHTSWLAGSMDLGTSNPQVAGTRGGNACFPDTEEVR